LTQPPFIPFRMFPSPAGPLEGILRLPREPRGGVVVCHPHPLYGGTMDNRIVYRLARAAVDSGCAALRFNFRGVGRSAGHHASGIGEREDVEAAIAFLAAQVPGRPLVVAGYSFGAWVSLPIACRDPRVAGVLAVGLPVALHAIEDPGPCAKPKLFLQGAEDEFGPAAAIESFVAGLSEPKRLVIFPGEGHFITARISDLEGEARAFFASVARARA
jgi:alpha/beta superfamily hydrolase